MPASSGTPLARWTCPELARHAAACGIAPAPSASTVRRWLADDALKPWQHRSWIFPRDPHFALKASRALGLYQREWEGEPLGEDEYVLSADEKPGVQARMRIHLPLPAGPGRAMRAESEYHRFGTLACLAAYDVHRARVMGRCEPATGIRPFTALVDQVMQAEPYASARRVFWVADNGASHRNWVGQLAARDHQCRHHQQEQGYTDLDSLDCGVQVVADVIDHDVHVRAREAADELSQGERHQHPAQRPTRSPHAGGGAHNPSPPQRRLRPPVM